MEKIERYLNVTDKHSLLFDVHLLAYRISRTFKLEVTASEINIPETEGVDFLDCLLKLREILEHQQLYILCMGAVTSVYPSRMSRDMSDGLKAYDLKLGKRIELSDVVDIFDPAPAEKVGTIAEQQNYFAKWQLSCRS